MPNMANSFLKYYQKVKLIGIHSKKVYKHNFAKKVTKYGTFMLISHSLDIMRAT